MQCSMKHGSAATPRLHEICWIALRAGWLLCARGPDAACLAASKNEEIVILYVIANDKRTKPLLYFNSNVG